MCSVVLSPCACVEELTWTDLMFWDWWIGKKKQTTFCCRPHREVHRWPITWNHKCNIDRLDWITEWYQRDCYMSKAHQTTWATSIHDCAMWPKALKAGKWTYFWDKHCSQKVTMDFHALIFNTVLILCVLFVSLKGHDAALELIPAYLHWI